MQHRSISHPTQTLEPTMGIGAIFISIIAFTDKGVITHNAATRCSAVTFRTSTRQLI